MIQVVLIVLALGAVGVSSLDENCPYEGCECVSGVLGCAAQNWLILPTLLIPRMDGLPLLDLQGNPLTTIPAGSLPSRLSSINFMDNPLTSIDDDAFDGSADTLQTLSFSKARFTKIPRALSRLNNLTTLEIGDTPITDWNVDVLKHIGLTLTSLSLSNPGLSAWPTWIQYFPHLQNLDLTSSFKIIPSDALDMQRNTLRSLNLNNGILSEIPRNFSRLQVLQTVFLDNNNISRIEGVAQFVNLPYLSLNNNSLSDATHVSEVLASLSGSITHLHIQRNQLTAFPDLSPLTQLQFVYLSNNRISNIRPGSIPTSVTYLELEGNNLRSLSSFLSNESNLQTLRVGMNFIVNISGTDIVSTISELDLTDNLLTELKDTSFPQNSSLRTLTLDSNPISQISTRAFDGLSQLRFLSLKNTNLSRLPLALGSLKGLYTLDLNENAHLVCTCLEMSLRGWSLGHDVEIFGDCGHTSVQSFLQSLGTECPQ